MADAPSTTAVLTRCPAQSPAGERAAELSRQLRLPRITDDAQADATELLLVVTDDRLELHWAEPAEQAQRQAKRKSTRPMPPVRGHPLLADWSALDVSSGAGRSLKQPLARALNLKGSQPGPWVIDATAGWGEDAWLMASLGCQVLMVERSPLIAAMLRDAIGRHALTSPRTTARLHLVEADAITLLDELRQGVRLSDRYPLDLPADSPWHHWPAGLEGHVHLDPMFPEPAVTGRPAGERKAMRLLRRLAGDDLDASLLFDAATRSGASRVIVKRPAHGATLGAKKADIVHRSKASRYDVHLVLR